MKLLQRLHVDRSHAHVIRASSMEQPRRNHSIVYLQLLAWKRQEVGVEVRGLGFGHVYSM